MCLKVERRGLNYFVTKKIKVTRIIDRMRLNMPSSNLFTKGQRRKRYLAIAKVAIMASMLLHVHIDRNKMASEKNILTFQETSM